MLKQCKSRGRRLGVATEIRHICNVTAQSTELALKAGEHTFMQTRLMVLLLITFLLCTAAVIWFNVRS